MSAINIGIRLAAVLATSAVMAYGALPAAASTFPPNEGMVVHVFDGDTLVVESRGRRYKIRILGIDTPEVRGPYTREQPFGKQASARTKELATGKKVTLEYGGDALKDKYGRLLAYVTLPDGADLGRILISEGLAEAFHHAEYSRKRLYHELESKAKQARLGIWSPPHKDKR
jgi:micrococcal nuclease